MICNGSGRIAIGPVRGRDFKCPDCGRAFQREELSRTPLTYRTPRHERPVGVQTHSEAVFAAGPL